MKTDKNILDLTPQVVYEYPSLGRGESKQPDLIDIIHIKAHTKNEHSTYYIAIKTSPCGDYEFVTSSFASLAEATKVFFDNKYDRVVSKYTNKNTLDLADEMFKKYVPSSGPSSILEGEALRAIFKLEYRFFNDGDMVSNGHGYLDAIKAPYIFLREYSERYPYYLDAELVKQLSTTEDKQLYECVLMDIKIDLCKAIVLNEDNLTENDSYDMYSTAYTNKANEHFNIVD